MDSVDVELSAISSSNIIKAYFWMWEDGVSKLEAYRVQQKCLLDLTYQ